MRASKSDGKAKAANGPLAEARRLRRSILGHSGRVRAPFGLRMANNLVMKKYAERCKA